VENEIITDVLKEDILRALEGRSFAPESITMEVQDEGLSVSIYVPVDQFPADEPAATFRDIGHMLDQIIPSRPDDYSWYVFFTRAGDIVQSFFGGDASSPCSGF
jgi:hypothetical protein